MNKLIAAVALCVLFTWNAPVNAGEYDKGISVGDKAPTFYLPAPNGAEVILNGELAHGPVVLSFYRGGWCPICNRQLQSFQEILPRIREMGATLIAVSPEAIDNAKMTKIENNLDFTVVSDANNAVAREYGIVWQVPVDDREKFANWLKETTGKTLDEINRTEDGKYELPIPATFVIDRDNTVVYAFKDPDYRKRADNAEILKALEELGYGGAP